MQNTYMTPLNYTNFAGQKRSTKLNFHITPREFADWILENPDQAERLQADFEQVQSSMENNPEGELSDSDTRVFLRLVKMLAELSYGVPSGDGEVFDKTDLPRFIHSAAYDAFRVFLFENPNEMSQFLNSILNEEVMKDFNDRLEAARAQQDEEERPALQSVGKGGLSKNPTKAELLEKIKELEAAKAGE